MAAAAASMSSQSCRGAARPAAAARAGAAAAATVRLVALPLHHQQQRRRPLAAAAQAARWARRRMHAAGGSEAVTDEQEAAAAVASAPEPAAPATPASEGGGGGAVVGSHPLEAFGAQELLEELTQADQQQLGKRGELMTIAQLALMALVLLPPFALHGAVDVVALVGIVTGVVFMAYGVWSLGRSLSPLPAPRKNNKLVTSGMFAYVRHPIYSGLLLASFGLAVITRNETRLVIAGLLLLLLEKKIGFEEGKLIERYGAEYEAYKKRVAKLLPFVY